MSKSSIIRKEIVELLQDGQEHTASELKNAIKKIHSEFELTDGIFANAFRTLTITNKLVNTERGVYKLNTDVYMPNEDIIEKKNEHNIVHGLNNNEGKTFDDIEVKQNNEMRESKECIHIKTQMLKIYTKMREEVAELVNEINIVEADEATVSYILEVRHALDEIEKNIKYN